VESTSGGFKFPDGSVQSSAAAKVYTTAALADLEIANTSNVTSIVTLTLPPGVYLITATVQFENRANDFLQDNTRVVRCNFINEFLGTNRLGAPGNPMDSLTTTMHTVITQSATGPVSLRCGNFETSGKVFAKARRLTAVRMADNPSFQ
jgi:hypothetical protein